MLSVRLQVPKYHGVVGPQNHSGYSIWDLLPPYLGTWTLYVNVSAWTPEVRETAAQDL